MSKITDILGSSVIKQKQRATESLEANINHHRGLLLVVFSILVAGALHVCVVPLHFKSTANWHTVSSFTHHLPILGKDCCPLWSCYLQKKCSGKFSYQKNCFHQFNTFC